MLVQLVTNGASAKNVMANSGSMTRGFEVSSNTDIGAWSNQIRNLMQFNSTPDEAAVMTAAEEAGNSSIAKTLFQDMVNYKVESIQNQASMWQTEMNAFGRIAGISAQVATTQDRMVQQFAQAAYTIGKSANYTKGVASAYANGLQTADGIM
jgi:replicative DNA helicase